MFMLLVLSAITSTLCNDASLRHVHSGPLNDQAFLSVDSNMENSLTDNVNDLLRTKAVDLVANPATTTVTTHESFFTRLKNSLAAFVVGVVLILLSIPVLWLNESRHAKMECLISWGRSECRTVSGKVAEQENHNWLVHIEGEQMHAAADVVDDEFDVVFRDDCVRLSRVADVYQVIQHEKTEEKETLGGGKDTVTTFEYTYEWSSLWNDSSKYNDKRQDLNTRPQGFTIGSHSRNCAHVEYGGGFRLADILIDQCVGWKSASERIGGKVTLKKGNLSFNEHDGFYYFSKNGRSPEQPEVGDARVRFEYVPDGSVTIVALQTHTSDDVRASFLPYRCIDHGWCGISDDDQKKLLQTEGRKTLDELVSEAGCSGILACLCCCFNVVMKCCAATMTPEINHLFDGSKSSSECFADIANRDHLMTWLLRLGGWLMLFIGCYSLFSPFLMFIRVLPFIGPFLSSLGGFLIWFVCLLTTLIVASSIIVIAYIIFRPMLGLFYGAIAAALAVLFIFIAQRIGGA